jgi:hypothetical protein
MAITAGDRSSPPHTCPALNRGNLFNLQAPVTTGLFFEYSAFGRFTFGFALEYWYLSRHPRLELKLQHSTSAHRNYEPHPQTSIASGLPLPKGEGRGEGEEIVRQPTVYEPARRTLHLGTWILQLLWDLELGIWSLGFGAWDLELPPAGSWRERGCINNESHVLP